LLPSQIASLAFGSALIGVWRHREVCGGDGRLNRLWFGSDWGATKRSSAAGRVCLNRLWFGSDWGATHPLKETPWKRLNRLWFGSDWGARQMHGRPTRDVSIAFGSALIGVHPPCRGRLRGRVSIAFGSALIGVSPPRPRGEP